MHGSYVLEAILPRLFQIEDLYLTNNYITGTIMERLAPALEKLTCLRKLFLQQNDLGKKGAEALKNSFPNMTSITLLTLDYCVLRAEGLLDISHGLRHLTLLQTLRINHNGLGLIKVKEAQEVCTVLSRSLSQMKHLKKVELAQSGFGPEDALILAQALLEANPNVDVDDKKVKEVLKFLRKEDELHAELAAKRLDFDDEESQPMRCMLSEVYSHNIVRHQPINKNQCGGCQSPRVSIVANFFKGKQGVETRRASFIGEKGSYNEHVVMKTVPYVPRNTCHFCMPYTLIQHLPHMSFFEGTQGLERRRSAKGWTRNSMTCPVFLETALYSLKSYRYLFIMRSACSRSAMFLNLLENVF